MHIYTSIANFKSVRPSIWRMVSVTILFCYVHGSRCLMRPLLQLGCPGKGGIPSLYHYFNLNVYLSMYTSLCHFVCYSCAFYNLSSSSCKVLILLVPGDFPTLMYWGGMFFHPPLNNDFLLQKRVIFHLEIKLGIILALF